MNNTATWRVIWVIIFLKIMLFKKVQLNLIIESVYMVIKSSTHLYF